jgi:4-hydroxybenzoate polyprenyltransferase
MKFLHLIRYKNLALIAFMQALFHFVFLKNQTNYIALSNWQFILLIIATLCIAAAGYVINDIEDQYADSINKPKKQYIGVNINENFAFYLYMILSITGIGIGYYLANLVGKNSFVACFIITSMLLYMYATSLKKIPFLGNVIIALLTAFSVLIVGFFDLLPATYNGNYTQQMYLFSVLIDFSIFAFIINLIREIIKDIEDVNGDYNADIKSLPVILGIGRTAKVVQIITVIAILLLLYYMLINFINAPLVLAYTLLFVFGPLILFLIKLFGAKQKADFAFLSNLLKIIMLFGILSIAVIQLNIYINA